MKFLFLLPAAALGLAVTAAPAGVIAYYPFDADTSDASGNGNHLTGPITSGAASAMITTTAGESMFGGGAADFNSAVTDQAYYDLTTPISFSASDAWSVAFWARHRPGNDGRTGMIVGDPSDAANFIWIPRDGAVDGIRVRTLNNTTQADYTTPPAGVEPAGVFHHFAVIADGSGNVEVFYDNASLGVQALNTSLSITSVGQAFNQATQSMNGQIDELYLFDEAIDAARVDALFNNIPEPSSGLLAALGGVALLRRRRGGRTRPPTVS